MIKQIILVAVAFFFGFLLSLTVVRPQLDIIDLLKVHRHVLNVEKLIIIDQWRYDLNNDLRVDDKDVSLIQAWILNE